MRRRNVKNAKQRIENHPELVIANPKEYIGKWHEVFNNDNPIYLEIGMGKGKFLREHALKNPNINYIGIEKFDSVIVQAVEKIAPLNLINIMFHFQVRVCNINYFFIKFNIFFH